MKETIFQFLSVFIPGFACYWIGWFVGRRFEREKENK